MKSYQRLKVEKKMWKMKAKAITAVIGALENVTTKLEK